MNTSLKSSAWCGPKFFVVILLVLLFSFFFLVPLDSRVYGPTQVKESNYEINILSERLSSLRQSVDSLYCKVFGIGSKGGFCLSDESIAVGGNQVWSLSLAQKIEEFVGNRTLLDLGAGLGFYGRYFSRKLDPIFPPKFSNVEETEYFNKSDVMAAVNSAKVVSHYEGYDGAANVVRYTKGFIQFMDLSEPQALPNSFDWVMSLEVGEHIPAQFEDVFLDNLSRHACRGIIMSWAVENQGGHHHVNNHNNDYVKVKMEERGFSSCPIQDLALRATPSSSAYWFKNTLMLFLRENSNEKSDCPSNYAPVEC